MPESSSQRGEQESREVLRDRIRAWWTATLADQLDQSYPVLGSDIKAEIRDGTLHVTGTVPTERDREELEQEVEHLRGGGFTKVQNDVAVRQGESEEAGLLVQMMIGVFESPERAGFAQGYLEGHAHVDPTCMGVIAPDDAAEGRAAAHKLVPEMYWPDVERALDADRSVLVVTVDEPEAFRVRQLLDEETSSLQTIVLPPETPERARALRECINTIAGTPAAAKVRPRAERGRHAALTGESVLHGG